MGRTLVIGDVHGANRALLQVLERSKFDNEKDTLISLGDVVDGWSESYEVVETLLRIKNLISIKGNHDEWFWQFIRTGNHDTQEMSIGKGFVWQQGAESTRQSYMLHASTTGLLLQQDIPATHKEFFRSQITEYVDDKHRCFIHGGFNRHFMLKEQPAWILYWDRDLWKLALSTEKGVKLKTADDFSEIFIGHTATTNWRTKEWIDADIPYYKQVKITEPMFAGGIWNLDTGAGWDGKLTIMDVDTHEYWQSDCVQELYKGEAGRF